MTHYCVLLNVIATDARVALQNLIASMRNYAVARRLPGTAPGDPADYYVLGLSGVALTNGTDPRTGAVIEYPVGFIVGYNQDCPLNVQNLIENITPYAESSLSPNPPLTRAALAARLRQAAGEQGCDHLWEVKPGDDVTTGVNTAAALLAKFSPRT